MSDIKTGHCVSSRVWLPYTQMRQTVKICLQTLDGVCVQMFTQL